MSKTKKVLDEIRGVIGFILVVTAAVIGLFALIPVAVLLVVADKIVVKEDSTALTGTIQKATDRLNKFVATMETKKRG